MTLPDLLQLADPRGHRRAPPLTRAQRLQSQAELLKRVQARDWCTIGVMASDPSAAWEALRGFERALGWSPLADAPPGEVPGGPVFLKLREEAGLGEGF